MSVHRVEGSWNWFFVCTRCKPQLFSPRYSSEEAADHMEQVHIERKHPVTLIEE